MFWLHTSKSPESLWEVGKLEGKPGSGADTGFTGPPTRPLWAPSFTTTSHEVTGQVLAKEGECPGAAQVHSEELVLRDSS